MQLDALGSHHVGYTAQRFNGTHPGFSVAGGRPFSHVSLMLQRRMGFTPARLFRLTFCWTSACTRTMQTCTATTAGAAQGGRFPKKSKALQELYDMHTEAASADKIASCITSQIEGEPVIVMAHNGPRGLGTAPHDPCGVDFRQKPDGSMPCLVMLQLRMLDWLQPCAA